MMRSAMIIDCHGHYTTAPPQLGDYREAQKGALTRDPQHVGEKGTISISDVDLAETPGGEVEVTFAAAQGDEGQQCQQRGGAQAAHDGVGRGWRRVVGRGRGWHWAHAAS